MQNADQQFDLIVVGGGINGAAVARDAAIRGLKVLLLEARDFASGASGCNGRMIHGGLRYLESGDFGLVREALRERSTLLKIAPHLVHPSRLIIPIKADGRPIWIVRLGLLVLDILAFGRMPFHNWMSKSETLKAVPSISADGLKGAAVMHDAFAEFAERLTIENLLDAERHGAVIMNYSPVEKISHVSGGGLKVAWRDARGRNRGSAASPVVVNTTGAWSEDFLTEAIGESSQRIAKAKGSFIVANTFRGAPKQPVFFEAKKDKRPIIITPWNNLVLIGTTDEIIDGPVEEASATDGEIDYIIESVNSTFSGAYFSRESVLYTYTGVRPLPFAAGKSHKISRNHVVHCHGGKWKGLITASGGKLSTFRSLAEEITNNVFELSGTKSPPVQTSDRMLPGADQVPANINPTDLAEVSEHTRVRLERIYGTRATELIALGRQSPHLLEVIDAESGAIGAEIVFAVQREWAKTLADILLRRTILGRNKTQGIDVIDVFRKIASEDLGWSDARIEGDIAQYRQHVQRTGRLMTPALPM